MRQGCVEDPLQAGSFVGLSGRVVYLKYTRLFDSGNAISPAVKPGSKEYNLIETLLERVMERTVNISRPAKEIAYRTRKLPFSHRKQGFPNTPDTHHVNDEPVGGLQ
jgi:hypothetical protein